MSGVRQQRVSDHGRSTATSIDPRFGPVEASLAAPWEVPDSGAMAGPTAPAQAAVALVLRASSELELLLVRRAVSERDPWSGHMALPGGRFSGDDSLLHTAIRETHEETGVQLDPSACLGALPPVSPQTRRVPTLRVSPFVFAAPRGTEATVASPTELDAVFWVPMSELSDPINQASVEIPLIGSVREFPAYLVADQTVWGMTYRILSRFLTRWSV